ncbi:MAG: hypothetical protein ACXV7I_06125, partial [Ilumatobacteraceae bacterium]
RDSSLCQISRTGGAKQVPIHRNVGLIFLFRHFSVNKPPCRDHGRQTARSYLGKTLLALGAGGRQHATHRGGGCNSAR